jgi:hypothetical protein
MGATGMKTDVVEIPVAPMGRSCKSSANRGQQKTPPMAGFL